MSDNSYFPVPESAAKGAHVDNDGYLKMYKRSVGDPEGFWAEHGKRVDWAKPFTKVKNVSYGPGNVEIKWFEDGELNVSHNCIDRHLEKRGDQTAIIWEGDDPSEDAKISYRELHENVCKLANVLRAQGVKKGDRVTIYMPMIPEAAYAMLACARIGAIHSVVFGGFSPDALAGRVDDCESNVVITADEGLRGGRPVPLKANTDAAAELCDKIQTVIVVKRTGSDINWVDGRDVWYHEAMADAGRLPGRADERGRPIVHTLYVWLDWKAEGRAAYVWRLSRLRLHDPSIRFRLSRRRYLLVHGGCRMGYRPQLHRLRTACERSNDFDVRRCAQLPGRESALAGLRQAQCEHLLHGAYGDPR